MTATPSLRPGTWIADPDSPTHALKPNADGSINANVTGGGGTSDFGEAFPATGVAIGFEDPAGDLSPAMVDADGRQIVKAYPFAIGGASQSISATTSSSNVSLATIGAHEQIMVTAPSTNALAFIAFGTTNAVVATVTDTPILPGTVQVFSVPSGTAYAAAITGSSTATLYFTPGDGE